MDKLEFRVRLAVWIIALLCVGFACGFVGGMHRATTGARIVRLDETEYFIEYDYAGIHRYSTSK